MLNLDEGLKAQMARLEERPVRLPWPITETDGTIYAMELDVPHLQSERWVKALEAAGATAESFAMRNMAWMKAQVVEAQKTAAAKVAGTAEPEVEAAESAIFGQEAIALAKSAGAEGIADVNTATLFRAEANALVTNGTGPAPILGVVTAGRLVPITIEDTKLEKALADPGMAAVAAILGKTTAQKEQTPLLTQVETKDVEKAPAIELTPEEISGQVFAKTDSSRTLPNPYGADMNRETRHVAYLRFIVAAAADHGQYYRRLGEVKKKSQRGPRGGAAFSPAGRSRKRRPRSGASKK